MPPMPLRYATEHLDEGLRAQYRGRMRTARNDRELQEQLLPGDG